MPKFNIRAKTETRGAIFSVAETRAAGRRMIADINEAIAQETVNRIHQRLSQVLQNPTGFYESKIAIDRKTVNRAVWDSGVVYGGWLEGIDPRNATSRFKGYSTFRRVRQEVDRDSVRIAQPFVEHFVSEMNR